MKKTIARMLAVCMVSMLTMGVVGTVPAQAHHKKSAAKLQKQINALKNKTSRINKAGTVYSGFAFAWNIVNFGCTDPDPAEFRWDDDLEAFFLECSSFPTASVDALTGNDRDGSRSESAGLFAGRR